MAKTSLIVGVIFFMLAIVIFIFADGLRRIYSGLFFAVIGTVMVANALRWRRTKKA